MDENDFSSLTNLLNDDKVIKDNENADTSEILMTRTNIQNPKKKKAGNKKKKGNEKKFI